MLVTVVLFLLVVSAQVEQAPPQGQAEGGAEATVPDRGQLHGKLSDRLSSVYAKLEKMKSDQEAAKLIRATPDIKHSDIKPHPDIAKDIGANEHFGYILDAIKSLQAQQITMSHAFNSVQNYMEVETGEERQQQQTLATSFAGLFDHLAQREDIEEVIKASHDDDAVHRDLEEIKQRVDLLRKGLKNLVPKHDGQDDSPLHTAWTQLQHTSYKMSHSEEIGKLSDVVDSLNERYDGAPSNLLYFILYQVVLVGSVLLFRAAKTSKPAGLII